MTNEINRSKRKDKLFKELGQEHAPANSSRGVVGGDQVSAQRRGTYIKLTDNQRAVLVEILLKVDGIPVAEAHRITERARNTLKSLVARSLVEQRGERYSLTPTGIEVAAYDIGWRVSRDHREEWAVHEEDYGMSKTLQGYRFGTSYQHGRFGEDRDAAVGEMVRLIRCWVSAGMPVTGLPKPLDAKLFKTNKTGTHEEGLK